MATSKKGKVNAKKAAPKKEAGTKAQAAPPAVVVATPALPVENSAYVTPVKGDIVCALGKFWAVQSVDLHKMTVDCVPLRMIEACMSGANFHRELYLTQITSIYTDTGYRG